MAPAIQAAPNASLGCGAELPTPPALTALGDIEASVQRMCASKTARRGAPLPLQWPHAPAAPPFGNCNCSAASSHQASAQSGPTSSSSSRRKMFVGRPSAAPAPALEPAWAEKLAASQTSQSAKESSRQAATKLRPGTNLWGSAPSTQSRSAGSSCGARGLSAAASCLSSARAAIAPAAPACRPRASHEGRGTQP